MGGDTDYRHTAHAIHTQLIIQAPTHHPCGGTDTGQAPIAPTGHLIPPTGHTTAATSQATCHTHHGATPATPLQDILTQPTSQWAPRPHTFQGQRQATHQSLLIRQGWSHPISM